MTRRIAIRTALLVLPLGAFVLYAALNWFRIEEVEVPIGMGKAALADPYLAWSRFLARMGARTAPAAGPSALDRLPRDGTLFLAARRLAFMTPGRVRRLDAWVRSGGTLVVEAEPRGIDDPMLEALGVERSYPEPANPVQSPGPASRPRRFVHPITFDWPEGHGRLRVRFTNGQVDLRDRIARADFAAARDEGQALAIAFPVGEGTAAAVSSFSFLGNGQLGDFDHAEFGWRLAAMAKGPEVVLFLKMESPSLGEWLVREAWPVLLAGGLLILLWLARIVPRFGPLAADPPPVRRSLLEHIAATGRYLWSRGEAAWLLDALRERVARAAARRPGAPTATLGRSLSAPGSNASEFVAAASSLQAIEAQLARRAPSPSSSRKSSP